MLQNAHYVAQLWVALNNCVGHIHRTFHVFASAARNIMLGLRALPAGNTGAEDGGKFDSLHEQGAHHLRSGGTFKGTGLGESATPLHNFGCGKLQSWERE